MLMVSDLDQYIMLTTFINDLLDNHDMQVPIAVNGIEKY